MPVAEHGAFTGEVTKRLPPLFELELPADRGVLVVDLAEISSPGLAVCV